MCAGSPRLGVLRRLRPVPTRSVDGGPTPSHPRRQHGGGAGAETVPVSTDDSLDEGGAQLCPCGIATATPQHFTVASRPDIHMPARTFPTEPSPGGCAPHPAHIRQVGAGEPLISTFRLAGRPCFCVAYAGRFVRLLLFGRGWSAALCSPVLRGPGRRGG